MYMFKKSTTAPKLIINFSTDAWIEVEGRGGKGGCTAVYRLQTAEPVLIAVLIAVRGDIKR